MWWLLEPTAYCPCCCLTVKRHHWIPGILKTIFNCSISLHDIHQLKHILMQSMIVRGKTKMKVCNPSHCQLKFKWKPNHNFNILLCHLVRHGTKCTFVNTKCFPLPGQWLRSSVPGALRRPPATAGCRLSGLRLPGSGTPPCRPEAASAWRCRSWAAPSRIDTAEQLHPAGGKKRMNVRGSLATIKGNRVSADETFVDKKILYIWMQEKTQ